MNELVLLQHYQLVAALLFGLHPLQTSAVTYVTQRMESLAACYFLLAIYCLIRSHQSSCPRKWAVASVFSCLLALFSKEFTVTLPFVAILVDRVYLAGSWGSVWSRRRVLYSAMTLSLGLFFFALAPKLHILQRNFDPVVEVGVSPDTVAREQNADRTAVDARLREAADLVPLPEIQSASGLSRVEFVSSQPTVILHYFRLIIIPIGQCFDYHWQPVSNVAQILTTAVAVGGGSFVLLVIVCWPGASRPVQRICLPLASVFILLSPRSTLQVLDLAVEYRMYLPLAPITGLTAWLIWIMCQRLFGQRRGQTALVLVGAVLCLILSGLTVSRNDLYSSRLAMWKDVVSKSPHNARARLNYASALVRQNDWPKAMKQTLRAVALYSEPGVQLLDPAHAYRRLGDRWWDVGDWTRAREAYLVAFRLNPALSRQQEIDRILRSNRSDWTPNSDTMKTSR